MNESVYQSSAVELASCVNLFSPEDNPGQVITRIKPPTPSCKGKGPEKCMARMALCLPCSLCFRRLQLEDTCLNIDYYILLFFEFSTLYRIPP